MSKPPLIVKIETRLIEIGMDKETFFKKSGVSSASYSQWNTGKHKPTKKKLIGVSNTIGIPIEELIALCDSNKTVKEQKNTPAVPSEGDLLRKKWASLIVGMNNDQMKAMIAIVENAKSL